MKVSINGEQLDYDGSKAPMSEALAVEKVYQRRYAEWQDDLQAGSAKAMCVLAWIIWRRDGRDVEFADILDGKIDFDLNEMLASILKSAAAERAAQKEAEAANPTQAGSDPDGTPGTATSTPRSSPTTSVSGRGKSGSSKSATSKR